MADYGTLEGDINHDEASFDHFRSELTCLTIAQCILTFWSRSGRDQGQGHVSELGWPYDKYMCLCLKGFVEVLHSN